MIRKTAGKIRNLPLIVVIRSKIPHALVNLFWHLPMAILANFIYGWPSKKTKVIGITGTDGKTTTSTLIYHILTKAGKKAALISTVSARIGRTQIDTGFHVTTPNPFALQKLLNKIAQKKYEYVVLESTSHGFAQFRLWGIKFLVGVVTNVAEDHLLYHKTWTNYLKAKSMLFKNTEISVLNMEDKSYKYLKKIVSGRVRTYGLKKGNFNLENFSFKTSLPGDYNKLNCLAAIAAADSLGIKRPVILKAIASFPGIIGRMEVMRKNPLIVVDFAHTPNALSSVLTTLREITGKNGRLISVFGCAGERDKNRRKMGKVSAQKSDITIITAEDPRREGVVKISNDIARWAKKGGACETEPAKLKRKLKKIFVKIDDREQAIAKALMLAKKGDVVGIFGKGHEKSMCYGAEEYPWSDQKIVKKFLSKI